MRDRVDDVLIVILVCICVKHSGHRVNDNLNRPFVDRVFSFFERAELRLWIADFRMKEMENATVEAFVTAEHVEKELKVFRVDVPENRSRPENDVPLILYEVLVVTDPGKYLLYFVHTTTTPISTTRSLLCYSLAIPSRGSNTRHQPANR